VKTQYLILAAVSALVLALLALMWPITRRSTTGPRLETLIRAQKLVSDLSAIRSTAAGNLDEATRLQDRLSRVRRAATPSSPGGMIASTQPQGGHKDWGWPDPDASTPEADAPGRPRRLTWPDLKLDGIVAAGDDSMAVINGEVYRLTDGIRNLQLTAIEHEAAVLTSADGESRRLTLSGWDKEASK